MILLNLHFEYEPNVNTQWNYNKPPWFIWENMDIIKSVISSESTILRAFQGWIYTLETNLLQFVIIELIS